MTIENASDGPILVTAPAGPPVVKIAYRGEGTDLFLIVLQNLFLTLITLGIYSPWARTVRRRYLWKQVDIDGQRLDYTGTGKELFIGMLKVLLGYLVLLGAPQLAMRFVPAARSVAVIWTVLGLVAFMVLLPFAVYWSRRYILGRTRWRGIRFGLAGSAGSFAKLWFVGSLLTVVTLGFYAPVFGNRIYAALMNNTRYGTGSFAYDGSNRDAFRIGIKGFFLSIVTFGIYSFWYHAQLQRFRMAHVRFDRATGALDVTGGLLFKLTMVNLFGNALTLGLAFPWTLTYTLRTILSRVTFVGPIDFSEITQQVASGNAAADTLAGALGVELGI
jgi:uncharacterized membrane protein YjgN (DUF898 family)